MVDAINEQRPQLCMTEDHSPTHTFEWAKEKIQDENIVVSNVDLNGLMSIHYGKEAKIYFYSLNCNVYMITVIEGRHHRTIMKTRHYLFDMKGYNNEWWAESKDNLLSRIESPLNKDSRKECLLKLIFKKINSVIFKRTVS